VLRRLLGVLCFCWLAILVLHSAGCWSNSEDQRKRDEKIREEAAKAAEQAKPQIQEAGRELGRAAEKAAEEAHAAAQGAKEGWERGGQRHPVDLNSASAQELAALPGISRSEAEKIIEGRPYHSKRDLVSKGILSESEYAKVRDYTTVK
jgi:DNA uptake protein ComE-like DNA-binding protein